MKRSRFTETQIVKAIQEHEGGRDAKDICRELGIANLSLLSFTIMVRAPKNFPFSSGRLRSSWAKIQA